MLIRANAKINLSLDVIGERPNGYHDVRMIMQSVNLYDELLINKREDNLIIIKCDNNTLECDKSNLIYKAAMALFEYCHVQYGVDIELTKNIPIAAGMAGGSTDAAATLVGLNKLFNLGLSSEQLREIGVKLGADIPFCIEGGTYLSEGIGEILTKVTPVPDCHLVIAKPDISVSTKFVYDNLILNQETVHPDVDGMLVSLNNHDLNGVANKIDNLLATVTEPAYPIIKTLRTTLDSEGALGALMSGSGPTVFGIFSSEEKATAALEKLHNTVAFKQGFVTTPARQGIVIVQE